MMADCSESSREEPPENLAKEVRDAVALRMKNETFNQSLGFVSGGLLEGPAETIPNFMLAARQRVELGQIHRLRKPSSWAFAFDVETSGAPQSVLAEAGPTPGGGFGYSSIMNIPREFFSAQVREILRAGTGTPQLALLQVPTYYFEALWLRTDSPEDDRLAFIKKTFGVFPLWAPTIPSTLVKLSVFVRYLNDRLEQGDRARPIYEDDDVYSGKTVD
ncbi:MAG: hypothetical protein R8G34_00745 [Paracoccaceae bacterium]|nr:hypothetical protein [Paracoccaceae bacterium]